MTRQELRNATDGAIIVDYIRTYSSLCLNENTGGGTKRYIQHISDLNKEVLRRGILSLEQLKEIE